MVARLLKLVLGALGLALYTWFAAVRSLPRVKARKTARQAAKAPLGRWSDPRPE